MGEVWQATDTNWFLGVHALREPQPQANRYRSKVWLSHVCPSSQVDEQARMDCEVDTRTKLATGGVAACGLAYTRRAGVDFVDAVALEVKSDSCRQPRLKYPFEPGFPISPWYRTHRINRRVLSLQGSDARSRTTEGDTWWVKKKTVRFSSHSTAC